MIGDVARVFAEVVVPVFAVAGVGYAFGRWRPVELAPVTALAVSVLVPAIVFDSLARAVVPRALLGRLVVHVALQLVVLGLLTAAIGKAAGWDGSGRAALLMAALFANAGNVGLPLALFAFGPAGLAVAGSWFAVHAVTVHTVGVFIAARARAGARAALRRFVRLPIFYAIVAGLLVNVGGVPLPRPAARMVELLAGGALAVLLLLLGLQLARLAPRQEARGAALATALRLLVAPPVAWVTGQALGLQGVALSVAVVQASTPTAVTAALWALEFDTRPALVTTAVVLSTLAGVVTLTLLLAALPSR